MALLALGINHKTASLDMREKVAFNPETLTDALREAQQQAGLGEVAILSTCNRTEFYGELSAPSSQALVNWLSQYQKIGLAEISQCIYQYEGEGAVKHMMRVASGLDSMVLGEPQILGQMKTAYSQAAQAGTLGPQLERLFQSTFSAAKHVRTETAIGAHAVSVGFAAVLMARQIFSDLRESKALLIGAGETIELVGRHLHEQGVSHITVANRTLARAQGLAEELGGKAITLEEIPEALVHSDIVISSTASPLPILGKGMVESALKKRRHQPIFMVDIAVPRDIEAEVGDLRDIYLYTVDDLQSVIEENVRSRQVAAIAAEDIVAQRAHQFMLQQRESGAISTLVMYRQQVESLRDRELAKAKASLQRGDNPDEVLEKLSRVLTGKLMHAPSIGLKKAATSGAHEKLQWSADLLGLSGRRDAGKASAFDRQKNPSVK